jgi:hypothetical protein
MKISKAKLHQIIKEELHKVLSEGEDDSGWGDTVYKLSGLTDRKNEAQRLFNIFFPDKSEYDLEILTHGDNKLRHVISKLYGWNLSAPFADETQPNPSYVKVGREFAKEGKRLNTDEEVEEFIDRATDYDTAKERGSWSRSDHQRRHGAEEEAKDFIKHVHGVDRDFLDDPDIDDERKAKLKAEYDAIVDRILTLDDTK